jgi:hypothetical protein
MKLVASLCFSHINAKVSNFDPCMKFPPFLILYYSLQGDLNSRKCLLDPSDHFMMITTILRRNSLQTMLWSGAQLEVTYPACSICSERRCRSISSIVCRGAADQLAIPMGISSLQSHITPYCGSGSRLVALHPLHQCLGYLTSTAVSADKIVSL